MKVLKRKMWNVLLAFVMVFSFVFSGWSGLFAAINVTADSAALETEFTNNGQFTVSQYNYLYADGTIDFVSGNGSKSLMGGTVIPLSKVDGGIQNPYIYYCGYSNGQIDWSQWLISK